ncbi:MAG: hypothetical protein ACFFDW_15220, partial [Candidatus Thorarchaeota archaeon]
FPLLFISGNFPSLNEYYFCSNSSIEHPHFIYFFINNENFTDMDEDGMPDDWEVTNNLDPTLDDSYLDPDIDELTNINEYLHNTNPWNPDTDGDGFNDYFEIMKNSDPTNPEDHPIRIWIFILVGALAIGLIILTIWIFIIVRKDKKN